MEFIDFAVSKRKSTCSISNLPNFPSDGTKANPSIRRPKAPAIIVCIGSISNPVTIEKFKRTKGLTSRPYLGGCLASQQIHSISKNSHPLALARSLVPLEQHD